MTQKFYNIKTNDETGDVIIDIFENIGGWLGYDDFAFKNALENAKGDTVTVRINSGGGDVFVGQNIYNMIKQSNKQVKVIVNGLAASIASVIAMAGNTIEMPSNAMMMIHNPSTMTNGTAEDMRKNAEVLDKVAETIKNVYMKRTGLSYDEITDMMNNETWMTAQEAKEKGFCDIITDEIDMDENQVSNSVFKAYNHVPKRFLNDDEDNTLEKRLSALEKRVTALENKDKKDNDDKKEDQPEPKKQPENGWASFFNTTK